MADEADTEAAETVAEAAEAAEERDWEAPLATAAVALVFSLVRQLRGRTYEARAEVPDATSEEASETASEAPAETDEAADLLIS